MDAPARFAYEQDDEVEQKGGRQGPYAAFALAVLIPVAAFLIYLEIGAPIAMDPDFTRQQRQMMAAQGGHSDAEILEQIAILEERLKEQPDNPDGWMMLARTQASFKNWAKSAEAFEAEAKRFFQRLVETIKEEKAHGKE